MRKLLLATGLLLAANAIADTDYAAILAEYYPADGPGAAALVVQDGEVLYRGARGMADIELNVPLSADNVFRIGSITKQFTTAAIMLLEQDGKLSVSDSINDHLPDYPMHGYTITIEHLMSHTSGIFNYTDTPDYWRGGFIRSDVTPQEMIEFFETRPMNFAPGEHYSYSNSGYILLGAIIEAVSGMSYADFIEQRIFEPLGMENSYYGGHQLIPNRATGYSEHDGVVERAAYISMNHAYAAGALLSTVDDLRRWNEALYGYELLPEEVVTRMVTDFELNDGEHAGYGYGIAVDEGMGGLEYTHSGGIHGFVTHARVHPDEDVFVAVLSNTDSASNPGFVATRMALDAAGIDYPKFAVIEVAEDKLEDYVGVYRINESETREVTLEDGQLYTLRTGGGPSAIEPHAADAFYYPGSFTYLTFDREDGKVVGMSVYQGGGDEAEMAALVDEEHNE